VECNQDELFHNVFDVFEQMSSDEPVTVHCGTQTDNEASTACTADCEARFEVKLRDFRARVDRELNEKMQTAQQTLEERVCAYIVICFFCRFCSGYTNEISCCYAFFFNDSFLLPRMCLTSPVEQSVSLWHRVTYSKTVKQHAVCLVCELC
jgi:hypothetical protein